MVVLQHSSLSSVDSGEPPPRVVIRNGRTSRQAAHVPHLQVTASPLYTQKNLRNPPPDFRYPIDENKDNPQTTPLLPATPVRKSMSAVSAPATAQTFRPIAVSSPILRGTRGHSGSPEYDNVGRVDRGDAPRFFNEKGLPESGYAVDFKKVSAQITRKPIINTNQIRQPEAKEPKEVRIAMDTSGQEPSPRKKVENLAAAASGGSYGSQLKKSIQSQKRF